MDILQQNVKPSADAIESSVGDETVLLHLKRAAYYGLDPVGTRIWSLLKEGRQPLKICEALVDEFGVDRAIIEEDVRRFLTDLKTNEIVVEA